MKIARFFAYIFACIGVLLLIGSMGFILLNRNADVRIRDLPQGAVSCCDAFSQALNDGDLDAAAQLIYGQPDLGVDMVPSLPESALLWDAFRGSIALELAGSWHVEQSALVRTGSITTLDVSGVMEKLPERVQSLLDQRIASAESLTDIYDENNNFRQELVETILEEALRQAMTQDAKTVTREVTVKLINRDGTWWTVPDQALLHALSGVA